MARCADTGDIKRMDHVSRPAPASAGCADVLIQNLHRHFSTHSESRCLLWINPVLQDPFDSSEVDQDRRVRFPVAHANFDPLLGPYLVTLDLARRHDSDLLERSVEWAWAGWTLEQLQRMRGQSVCGWITCSVSANDLARHWAASCYLHRWNGLDTLLRFHDPGVREWLWPMLDAQQRHTLLGPAQSIWAIGRQHSLLVQERSPEDLTAIASAPSMMRLQLRADQWSGVSDFANVHAAWQQLCSQDSLWADRLAMQAGWPQRTFHSLQHASRYGLHDARCRTLFARHALEIGMDFHLAPLLAPVWLKTAEGVPYGRALEDVIHDRPDLLAGIFRKGL